MQTVGPAPPKNDTMFNQTAWNKGLVGAAGVMEKVSETQLLAGNTFILFSMRPLSSIHDSNYFAS